MNKASRAAQFMPFDAMKGLQEALRAKEEKLARVQKSELSEEQKAKLSLILQKLEKGASVTVTFYRNGHYITFSGQVNEKNLPFKYITIDNNKIFFEDVFELHL